MLFKLHSRYVYYEEGNVTADNALAIHYAAKKYMITQLENMCTAFIEKNLDQSNVCTLFQRSTEFSAKDLEKTCFAYIQNNAASVLKSDNIVILSYENMLRIICSDILLCKNESAVYEACIKWATGRCQADRPGVDVSDEAIRDMLGAILYEIRLPQIEFSVLGNLIGTSWVVSPEEKGYLFSYVFTKETSPLMKFSMTPRIYTKYSTNRFCNMTGFTGSQITKTNDQVHSLCMQTSADTNLLGFTMVAGNEADHPFNAGTLTVTGTVGTNHTTKVPRKTGTAQIELTMKPIRIQAGVKYTIAYKFDTIPEYKTIYSNYRPGAVGGGYQRSTTGNPNQVTARQTGPTFTFTPCLDDNNHTSPTCGQFTHVLFGLVN